MTRFLNVDLDMGSRLDLHPLIAAMGSKVIVLHSARDKRSYVASLALGGITRSADATIRRFCRVLQALPAGPLKTWEKAQVRDFNIGIEAGFHPHSTAFDLSGRHRA